MRSQPLLLEVIDVQARDWLAELGVKSVRPGDYVLVWGVGTHEGCREVIAFDPHSVARVVAFHDAVVGTERAVSGGRPRPVAVHVPTEMNLEAWAIGGLGAHDTRLDSLLPHIVRSECYQIIRHVLRHRTGMSIGDMAAGYGLSAAQFYRNCKQIFGRPLKRQLRVIRAASALLDGVGRKSTLTTVAMDNGYASASHFTFDVRNLLGRPPGQAYTGITSILRHEKNSLTSATGSR
jgi:AraC-like DNA-binding protein